LDFLKDHSKVFSIFKNFSVEKKINLDELRGWLAPLLSDATPPWIAEGMVIEKRDIIVVVRYWLGFIYSSLMSSQNESIIHHLLGSIIEREQLNLGMIIASAIAMRAQQNQTSLHSHASLLSCAKKQVFLLWPMLTQAANLKMAHIAHSTDVRASCLKAQVPIMINRAIECPCTSLGGDTGL